MLSQSINSSASPVKNELLETSDAKSIHDEVFVDSAQVPLNPQKIEEKTPVTRNMSVTAFMPQNLAAFYNKLNADVIQKYEIPAGFIPPAILSRPIIVAPNENPYYVPIYVPAIPIVTPTKPEQKITQSMKANGLKRRRLSESDAGSIESPLKFQKASIDPDFSASSNKGSNIFKLAPVKEENGHQANI